VSKENNKKPTKNWRTIATILASILAAGFIFWQKDSIIKSFDYIKQASPEWLALAVVFHALSVVSAAAVYWQISLRKTKYYNLLVCQAASLFTSRVTPAGVGGLATMGKVLQNSGHKAAEIGLVLSANAIVTFLGNVALTLFALLISGRSLAEGFKIPKFIFLIPLFVIIIAIIVYTVKSFRTKVTKLIKDMINTLGEYKTKKKNLFYGFCFGVLTTFGYMLALWAAAVRMVGFMLAPVGAPEGAGFTPAGAR
jgi:undecaprenyl-diphosphatase